MNGEKGLAVVFRGGENARRRDTKVFLRSLSFGKSQTKLLLFKLEGFLCLLRLYVLCLFQYELVFNPILDQETNEIFFPFAFVI
jgi:hypothetical protein